MLHSIGMDLIEIGRIRRAIDRKGDRFLNRIYTPAEIAYCDSKIARHINYAGRWAAKEAVLKAFGMGMRGVYSWQEVEIINDSMGRPEVHLGSRLLSEFDRMGGKTILVSISHCHDHATAIAAIEKKDSVE